MNNIASMPSSSAPAFDHHHLHIIKFELNSDVAGYTVLWSAATFSRSCDSQSLQQQKVMLSYQIRTCVVIAMSLLLSL